MKYLLCFQLPPSGTLRDDYARIEEEIRARFAPQVKCTKTAYLLEAEPLDLDDMKQRIRDILLLARGL